MKQQLPVSRRRFLQAPLIAGLGWIGVKAARAATPDQKATLIAKFIDRVPVDPEDSAWEKSDRLIVPLAPQAVVKSRTYKAATSALTVRGLYDEERIAFLLEWKNDQRNTLIGTVSTFGDAVAIEFPSTPAAGIPYFAMGEPDKPVTIYQWKADWQFSRHDDVDESYPAMAVDWYPLSGHDPGEIAAVSDYGKQGAEKSFHTSWWSGNLLGDPELQTRTPVEKLRAEGFGTLTSLDVDQQDASGKGQWRDDRWRTVLSFPRAQEAFHFAPGLPVPIAFAVWNGAAGERGGEKAVSTWYFLSLEQPLGKMAFIAPVLALAGAIAAQGWILGLLRRNTERSDEEDT